MSEKKKGIIVTNKTRAHVKIYIWLYNAVPMTFWQAFWLKRHLSCCPKCLEALGLVEEKPLDQIGVTPARAESLVPGNQWDQITVNPGIGSSQPVSRGRYVRKWQSVLIPTTAAILLLAVSLGVLFNKGTGRKTTGVQVQNQDIVIRFVSVDDRPAEAVYVQPGDDDRVIIWVKKTSTRSVVSNVEGRNK